MKPILISIICFAMIASPVFAQGQINTSGLTPTQRAELELKAAEYQEANENAIPPAEKMKEYADAGQAIAVAIGSCAKELGVAVDDFSKTRVGTITMVILCWKLIGKDILGIIVGSLVLTIGLIMWTKYFRKMCLVKKIEYHESGKVASITHYDTDDVVPHRWVMLIILIILVAVCMMVILL